MTGELSTTSSENLHTILGAGGAIATELTRELLKMGSAVRLVGRKPRSTAGVFDARSADLSDFRQALEAVEGSATPRKSRPPLVFLRPLPATASSGPLLPNEVQRFLSAVHFIERHLLRIRDHSPNN